MPTELTTPFDEEQRSKADQELVSVVLGERAAEEMSTLINQDKTKESITTAPTKLELSGDETSRIQKEDQREHVSPEERRDQYIEYFDDHMTERVVDKTFKFNSDGTVEALHPIDIRNRGNISELPPGLKKAHLIRYFECGLTDTNNCPEEVEDDLDLRNNEITSIEGVSKSVGGDLFLGQNPIESLDPLRGTTIGGELWLVDIKAKTIPEGINVSRVNIGDYDQDELAHDAIKKGYQICYRVSNKRNKK